MTDVDDRDKTGARVSARRAARNPEIKKQLRIFLQRRHAESPEVSVWALAKEARVAFGWLPSTDTIRSFLGVDAKPNRRRRRAEPPPQEAPSRVAEPIAITQSPQIQLPREHSLQLLSRNLLEQMRADNVTRMVLSADGRVTIEYREEYTL